MNGKATIAALQREISSLQTSAAPIPDALMNQLAALQNELRSQSNQPTPSIPIVIPTPPPPPNLTPDQQEVWATFYSYHGALCSYSGEVNRGQWLHLVDVAADLTGAAYSIQLENYVLEAPTGALQPWARDGATKTWILSAPSIQNLPSGVYGLDASTNTWSPLTNLGPAAPVTNPPGGLNNYASIDATAPMTNPPGGANNYAPLNGRVTGATPAAGQVGELIRASASAIQVPVRYGATLATASFIILAQISLSAGDWDVSGYFSVNGTSLAATSPYLWLGAYLSTVPPQTPPVYPNLGANTLLSLTNAGVEATAAPVPTINMTAAVPTVVYLLGNADTPTPADDGKLIPFTGNIRARRMS
jgi:hypothetical protein